MPSITEILNGMAQAASGAADELDRVNQSLHGTADQAERIAEASSAPRAIPPGSPSDPFNPPPITDGNRLLPPSSSLRPGEGGAGLRPGSGGGALTTSTGVPESEVEQWRSDRGGYMPAAWVKQNCRPVESAVSVTEGGRKTITVWVCPEPHGTFYPPSDERFLSAKTSGGGVNRPKAPNTRPYGGRGITSSTVGGVVDEAERNRQTPPQSNSGLGLDSLSGQLEQTNRTLSSIDNRLAGDDGASLRAGGGL